MKMRKLMLHMEMVAENTQQGGGGVPAMVMGPMKEVTSAAQDPQLASNVSGCSIANLHRQTRLARCTREKRSLHPPTNQAPPPNTENQGRSAQSYLQEVSDGSLLLEMSCSS